MHLQEGVQLTAAAVGLNIADLPPQAFLRLPQVLALCGLRRSTLWDQVRLGRFPSPVKLTAHASGWRVRDVTAWLEDPRGWGAASERRADAGR